MLKNFSILIFVLFLAACAGDSSDNADSSNNKIISSFTITPKVVVKNLETEMTIDYSLNDNSNSVQCILENNRGELNLDNKLLVSLDNNTIFQLKCVDEYGNIDSKTQMVYIAEKPEIKEFKVYPSVIANGETHNVTFNWKISKYTYPHPECNIDADNINYDEEDNFAVAKSVSPEQTFTLTCSNIAGSDSKQIYISGKNILTAMPNQTVTKEGGTFYFGDIVLEIPENAVNDNISVNIIHDKTDDVSNLLHNPFKIIPDNFTFNVPITVKVYYNIEDIKNGGHNLEKDNLTVFEINNGNKLNKNLISNRVLKANEETYVSFKTDKTSTYALGEDNTKPPFDKKIIDIIKTEEIAFFNPNKEISFFDDKSTDYTKTKSDFSSYYKNYHDTVVADFDLDGKDEIAASRINNDSLMEVIIYKYIDNNIEKINNITISAKDENSNETYIKSGDITAGDIDGDGIDELIISDTYIYGYVETKVDGQIEEVPQYYADIHIYKYSNQKFSLMHSLTLKDTNTIRLTCADTNHDGIDEIYAYGLINKSSSSIAYGLTLSEIIIKGNLLTLKTIPLANSIIPDSDYRFYDIASGNFDSDKNEELVLVGYNDTIYNIEVIRDSLAKKPYDIQYRRKYDFNNLSVAYNHYDGTIDIGSMGGGTLPNYFIPISTGDFNFDKIDEIIIGAQNLYDVVIPMIISINNDNLPEEDKFIYGNILVNNNYEYANSKGVVGGTKYKTLFFTAGDINSDGFDELITIQSDKNKVYGSAMQCELVNTNNHMRYGFKRIFRHVIGDAYMSSDLKHLPIVASGDFDGDNIKVKYTGNHKVNTIDPVIIAAIAAPPTWDNETIQEELHKSETSYGTKVSSGNSDTKEVGFSFGITVGVKTETPVWDFVEASASYDWTTKQVTSTTTKKITAYGTSYSTDFSKNYVVFTSPTYDSYLYEVISHPDIENIKTESDGKKYITINIPKESLIYKWDLEYFKENSKTPIDENVFQHTIGEPFTYPTDSEKESILQFNKDNCDKDSDNICSFESPIYTTVGEGSSKVTSSISFEQESISENKKVTENSLEAEICVAGICGGTHGAYETANIYELSAGKEMEFEGTVADIASEFYTNYKYMYKLFVYFNKDTTNNQKYLVINYSVEHN